MIPPAFLLFPARGLIHIAVHTFFDLIIHSTERQSHRNVPHMTLAVYGLPPGESIPRKQPVCQVDS